MSHLTDAEIGTLLAGRADPALRQRLVFHLFEGCEACSARLRGGQEAADEASYEGAVARAWRGARTQQRRWRRERELRDTLVERWRHEGIHLSAPRSPQWARVQALLRLTAEERYRDPGQMLEYAWLAVIAADTTLDEDYGPEVRADLRARAWAEYGNAYRLNDKLLDAEEALALAEELSLRGSGDPLVAARIFDVQATLRVNQRRLADALRLLERVIRLYRAVGERHLLGRAQITKAIYTHYDGRPDAAVRLFDEGLLQLDLERDVRLAVVAVKDKAHALADCGEFEKAWQLLRAVNLREVFAGDPLTLLRLRGIEGKILAGLGRLEAAQEAFTETRAGFLEHKQAYHAALVGLELAAVLLRRKRTERAAQLAKEALAIFQRLKVHQEAVRALDFCVRAFRQKEASAALLQRAISFLSALEWNPRLQFQPWGPH